MSRFDPLQVNVFRRERCQTDTVQEGPDYFLSSYPTDPQHRDRLEVKAKRYPNRPLQICPACSIISAPVSQSVTQPIPHKQQIRSDHAQRKASSFQVCK